jgi:hypothetical protein
MKKRKPQIRELKTHNLVSRLLIDLLYITMLEVVVLYIKKKKAYQKQTNHLINFILF